MEPPNSVQGEDVGDPDGDELSVDGFAIVHPEDRDGPTPPTDPTAMSNEAPTPPSMPSGGGRTGDRNANTNSEDGHQNPTTDPLSASDDPAHSSDGAPVSPDEAEAIAQAEADADLMSVEQWLAEAQTPRRPGGTATDAEPTGDTGPGPQIAAETAAEAAAAEESADSRPDEADSEQPESADHATDDVAAETVDDGDGTTLSDSGPADTHSGDADIEASSHTSSESDTGTSSESESETESLSDSETGSEVQAGSAPTEQLPETGHATTGMVTAVAAGPVVGKRRTFPIGKLLVAAVIGGYLVLTLAWGLDMAAHRGAAMRGVFFADRNVGGSDRDSLEATVDGMLQDLSAQPMEIVVGTTTIDSDPVTLGARLDSGQMIEEALGARRDGVFFVRPVLWLGGLFSDHVIEPSYVVDPDVAAVAAGTVIAPVLNEPVEPTLELTGTEMTVSPGSPGVMIETEEIVGLLPGVVEAGAPYRLELLARDSEPELETSVVADIADEINRQTDQPITVQVLDDQAEISPERQKAWIELVVEDGEAGWTVIEDLALADLKPLFPALGSEDQLAKFTVVDGEPIILPASESVVCCEPGSGDDLLRTMQSPIPAPIASEDESDDAGDGQPLRSVTLEPIVTGQDDGVAELESLGIIEEVSTFTTNHACCENRVKNIQRFADLLQGTIVRPGEELSLNGAIGERTIAKGFVADGAISLGNFEQQVGGGISQYATTFFNASFFAGVEFLEYQSHSIYISRYPRGREATISWRRPDLKIRNNTEYGILVWNEYTPTSITVTFYSTKHLTVDALPLKRSSDRKCRIDITPRRITHPDGTQAEDSVRAVYRPGEGLDCNGDSTTPEDEDAPEPASTTTSPPSTTPPPTSASTTTTEPPSEGPSTTTTGEVLPTAG